MIDLKKEKEYRLSADDRFNLINFSITQADNNGFISSFIFERALYVYAAIMLDEEHADEIRSEVVNQGIISAWDLIVQKDYLSSLLEEYKPELDVLADEGKQWFDEYTKAALSARGILNLVEQFSGDIVSQAANTLKSSMEESGASNVIDIADKWGMNNTITKENPPIEEDDKDSLF